MRVEIFHNVDSYSFFGYRDEHALVKVFEYDTDDAGFDQDFDAHDVLSHAFETFNIGTDELAARYRARRLRSLSVGDAVVIEGRAYSVEGIGWRDRERGQFRVLTNPEAERTVRARYDFKPHEYLTITVPWEE